MENTLFGKVIGACLDKDGKIIGTLNKIPFLNTILYEVQFKYGTSQAYGANLIAENMWRMANDEGYYDDTLHLIIYVCYNSNAVKDNLSMTSMVSVK